MTQPSEPLKDGEPCEHPGCLNHLSHPCEGCGRVGGRTPPQYYYILSLKWSHNEFCLWWRPDNKGYTGNLDEAGRYEAAEALTEYHNDGKDALAVPCALAEKYVARIVDAGHKKDILADLKREPCLSNSTPTGSAPTVTPSAATGSAGKTASAESSRGAG